MRGYQLLDAGDFQRLEQWGEYRIIRPDPMADWPKLHSPLWQRADAVYRGTTVRNGEWSLSPSLPSSWIVELDQWKFTVGLGTSKHLGLFPEQLVQWQLLQSIIQKNASKYMQPIQFLNLFAYTGAASVVATKAGAFTTHVDSSTPAIGRAKENQMINGLHERSIRWVKEDVLTFVKREIRRGHTYDIIALDPPAYGHGTRNENFNLHKQLTLLLQEVHKLLSKEALAVIVTVYTKDWQPTELRSLCKSKLPPGTVSAQPLSLTIQSTKKVITTGSWAVVNFDQDSL